LTLAPQSDAPYLGLVCITYSDKVRFRTITRTRYLSYPEEDRPKVLRALYSDNLARLHSALRFCQEQAIPLYRLSSALFPFSDYEDEVGAAVLESMSAEMALVGQRAAEIGLRVVMHPDQFVVLSSDSPQVVASSIRVLAQHSRVMDLFGLPGSAWSAMTIHGGKANRAAKMVEVIGTLPDNIRQRLVLENDEYAYGAAEILEICQRAGVPMVFDVHHHVCHDKLDSYEDPSIAPILAAARQTWPVPQWQMVHLSNGKESFQDRRHSDLITVVPSAFWQPLWVEVEAKHKELAIAQLRSF
jgi:UV DNA damage endonuclease